MADKIRKTELVRVQMTSYERAALEELAARSQLSTTDFVRDVVRTLGRRAGLLPTVPTVEPAPEARAV